MEEELEEGNERGKQAQTHQYRSVTTKIYYVHLACQPPSQQYFPLIPNQH